MKFYEKRSAEEQENRLPPEFRLPYRRSQIDRIEIDGNTIQGYFEYSFMEEKSYTTQPVRTMKGAIEDINDYTTFLTPRLIIKYNMMAIDDYRTLMKLLKSKNAFMVTCYDIVEDKRVTNEMYFATPAMPIIYQQYLNALGIREYTIELIGTNRFAPKYEEDEKILIRQWYNLPSDYQTADGSKIIDKYRDIYVKKGNSYGTESSPMVRHELNGVITEKPLQFTNYYSHTVNTAKDGSGETIYHGDKRTYTTDMNVYMMWVAE